MLGSHLAQAEPCNPADQWYDNLILYLQAINELLPVLAMREVDRLIAELQDGQFQLEFEPTSTEEYVKSLTFLDKIQDRVSICVCVCVCVCVCACVCSGLRSVKQESKEL